MMVSPHVVDRLTFHIGLVGEPDEGVVVFDGTVVRCL